ncbi:MAG: nucleotidyl transferase AbiEii/AbiGii toxin family protein [Bacteroidaceae bacterium]|nr:nucleotidyl transferase AbiEii/AbiGii toxin family protein [Bacteroidaceae bacterium]
MRKFLTLTDSQRKNVYESISHKVNLPAQVVEKDFWVTAVLQTVFSLPIAEHLVFKGGTSLSKGWKLIERFSEDIDLAVDPVFLGANEGDLTKKQIKKLRKASSLFVLEQLTPMIRERIADVGLQPFITLEAQPNGEGDNTYPEPRQVYFRYQSVFSETLNYLRPDIVLEVSARSLLEPTDAIEVKSILAEHLPFEPLTKAAVHTAVPAKTFLEKAFLLHEIFSVPGHGMKAERKSRHLYDLYVMMNKDFAKFAINDNQLWESIRHHREIYTSVRDMDYTPEVRHRMLLVPREDIIDVWRNDYEAMKESMIYGKRPTFDELVAGMLELQEQFRDVIIE